MHVGAEMGRRKLKGNRRVFPSATRTPSETPAWPSLAKFVGQTHFSEPAVVT